MTGRLLATLAALALAACSSDNAVTQPGLAETALSMARARMAARGAETAPAQAPPQVTRAQMEALGRPVVYTAVPRLSLGQPAVEVARNRGFVTFIASDQSSITLRDGIVSATRGLPVDLFAQRLSITPGALFRGTFPKTYERTQRHLTGEGTLDTRDYVCAIAPAEKDEVLELFGRNYTVRQYTEVCQNRVRAFQNSYWVDRRGTVWQSHQSISREVGHMVVQRVVQ
ncbi:MAG: YjbF family lipoprotein [Pseudomonadota bacterium]